MLLCIVIEAISGLEVVHSSDVFTTCACLARRAYYFFVIRSFLILLCNDWEKEQHAVYLWVADHFRFKNPYR